MEKNQSVCMNDLCSEYKVITSKFLTCKPPTRFHQEKCCVACGAAFYKTEDVDDKKTSSNNFKCPETGKEFFVSQYSTKFEGSETIYLDKWKKPLINLENKALLVPIKRDRGFGTNTIGKFNTGTADGRERIKNHFAARANTKSHEVKEIKDAKLKEFKDANLGK